MRTREQGNADWITTFQDFFEGRSDRIETLFNAGGCRELWVQGEFYLDFHQAGMETNATKNKYDLKCGDMIAELKFCGGDYQKKMMTEIEKDLVKLQAAASTLQRYFILVIDRTVDHTPLADWLMSCEFPDTRSHTQEISDSLVVRYWEVVA